MAVGTGIFRFLGKGIWSVRRKDLPRSRALLIGFLRVPVLAFRKLIDDQCLLRASALTYFSLLSLVPFIAVVLAVAKGFGFQKKIESMLLEQLEGQREIVTRMLEFSQRLLDTVTDGLVAGIGVVLLLYTILSIFSSIEEAFNVIWKVEKSRTIGRKISDYLSLMIICPIIFLVSSSLTIFVASEIEVVVREISFLGPLGRVILFTLGFLPYVVLWVFFSFIYMILPNIRVHFVSGVLGGVVAGTIFQIFQWAYIGFQIGVSRYNAIYGSFAALPLFFVWLQISWIIVLFGAEIAFAHQNADAYEFEEDYRGINHASRNVLSLRILHLLVQGFVKGEPPPHAARISQTTEIPLRLVRQILDELMGAKLVSEVRLKKETGPGYQPSRDPEILTIRYAIQALEERGGFWAPDVSSREMERIKESLGTFEDVIDKSPANLKLKEL
jgi:membrane protein